jgi:hypothetical protein
MEDIKKIQEDLYCCIVGCDSVKVIDLCEHVIVISAIHKDPIANAEQIEPNEMIKLDTHAVETYKVMSAGTHNSLIIVNITIDELCIAAEAGLDHFNPENT